MATIYWRGRCASLNWVEAGERRRESLGAITPAEAEAALTGLERRLAGASTGAGCIFAEWAHDYATWHRDEYPDSYPRVEQILRCYLIPYFGLTPIGAITRQEVEGYKHGRLGAAAAGTITKELRTLQACLNKAAPSLDRIEPVRGYGKGNIRLVCNCVNAAMGSWGEEVLFAIARALRP